MQIKIKLNKAEQNEGNIMPEVIYLYYYINSMFRLKYIKMKYL